MNTIANSTGDAKSTPPRAVKPMSLDEALEYLRSAMHFIAVAGAESAIENTANGLHIDIPGAMFYDDESGDIYFAARPAISPPPASIATATA